MTFLELPDRHDRLAEKMVRATGIVPSTCQGMLVRVGIDGKMVDRGSDPFIDQSARMEGRPNSFAPVYFLLCLTCRKTEVLEECIDIEGRTFWKSRNAVDHDHGRWEAEKARQVAATA